MRRRFSQAISEGDGISLLASVRDVDAARAAEDDGAEGIVVAAALPGVREATELPILSAAPSTPGDGSADAWLLPVDGFEEDVERLHEQAREAGLECVVAVGDEDELRLALDRLDPEIFLLAGKELDHVLSLLPDVPAGKLAVVEADVRGRGDVAELERAGVDAVIVRAEDVAGLSMEPQPEP
jgi:NAD(P)H-dependent flavin oxidoreductase YrpB (nitropropane dioxygenase family)